MDPGLRRDDESINRLRANKLSQAIVVPAGPAPCPDTGAGTQTDTLHEGISKHSAQRHGLDSRLRGNDKRLNRIAEATC